VKYYVKASLLLLAAILLLSACNRLRDTDDDGIVGEPTATRNFVPVSTNTPASSPLEPTPLPTTVPSVTATPIPITIEVDDQILGEDGQLTISRIESSDAGWVVIYNEDSGNAGEVLGFVHVPGGVSEDIDVSIDPYRATAKLLAIHHQDEGQANTFEFPGPDTPSRSEGEVASSEFSVELKVFQPEITVREVDVGEDGLVVIPEVIVASPSWIKLHEDEDGQPGRMLAYAPLKTGVNVSVTMTIDWRTATPTLHASLYADDGDPGKLEDVTVDRPVVIDDAAVTVSFDAVYPPDIFVLDQPVLEDEVVIERVISYGSNWLVIYNQNEENALGNVIGWTQLEPGVNSGVTLTVTESAVTPVLYAMIHQDEGEPGQFDFPGSDLAITYDGSIYPFPFRTDTGSYFIVHDQMLSGSATVTITLASVEANSWITILADEDGEPGEVIGRTWIPAGINRNIEVTLDEELITPVVYAMLLRDAGFGRVFEYDDGVDFPYQLNGSPVRAPFSLIDDGN
jgi:hypothetical protein